MERTIVKEIRLSLSAEQSYSPDINALLLSLLTQRHVGKCLGRALIKSVDNIVQRSSLMQTQSYMDGTSYVDIKYVLSGIYYEEGDLLGDVEPQKDIGSGNLVCASRPDVLITCTSDRENLTGVKLEGLTIPVEITRVVAKADTSKIQLTVKPFEPLSKTIIYKLKDVLENPDLFKDLEAVAKLVGQVTIELEALDKSTKALYDEFRVMLWPMKTWKSDKEAQLKPLMDLCKELLNTKSIKLSGVWIYSPLVDPASCSVVVAEEVTNNVRKNLHIDIYPIVEEDISGYAALRKQLRRYVYYQRMLINMAKAFVGKPELKSKHKQFWTRMYGHAKK